MRKRILGFTLIELMIVIAIIAIIAAIAIPGLLRARMASHEGNASASLRSLATAQASFQKANTVAQDEDGQGEFGLLNELTGQASVRYRVQLRPPSPVADFPAAMKADSSYSTSQGLANKAGYYFQAYLPMPTGEDVLTDNPSASGATILDFEDTTQIPGIEQQEIRWIAYAWPTTFKSSGLRAFVVDNSATVYTYANADENNDPTYDGTSTVPNYNDAMSNLNDTPTELSWTEIAVRDEAHCVGGNFLWVESQ